MAGGDTDWVMTWGKVDWVMAQVIQIGLKYGGRTPDHRSCYDRDIDWWGSNQVTTADQGKVRQSGKTMGRQTV